MAKDLTQALHELTMQAQGQTSRKNTSLPAPKPVSAIPQRSGKGIPPPVAPPSEHGTGGDFGELGALREYWPERTIGSTDGIFFFKIKPTKKMTFSNLADEVHNDANNLVLRIDNPLD